MADSPAARRSGEHLSDVDIAKILALDKASTPQRKIAPLIKCSRKAIQNVLAKYNFETIHRRVWKPDIDMARYYRRFGIIREWN